MANGDRAFLLLANPRAGRGAAANQVAEVAAALREAGAPVDAVITASIEHATELAASAASAGRIAVAVGGDGLARAVASGVAAGDGVMGLIPAGRGNDFARAIGAPADLAGAVRVLRTCPARATDCIGVTTPDHSGERVALGNVYLGFDSLSNVAANRQRVHWGRFAYSVAALRVALTMPVLRFSLVVDGDARSFDGSGVAIASSAFYGGAIEVAPGARPDDGVLDLVLFEATRRAERVSTLLALRNGDHIGRRGVRTLRGREISLRVEPSIEAYADGDPIAAGVFRARVLPGKLRVIRP